MMGDLHLSNDAERGTHAINDAMNAQGGADRCPVRHHFLNGGNELMDDTEFENAFDAEAFRKDAQAVLRMSRSIFPAAALWALSGHPARASRPC